MTEGTNLPPSPKKLREARKQGKVAKSPLFTTSLVLFGGFLSLYFFGPWAWVKIQILLQYCSECELGDTMTCLQAALPLFWIIGGWLGMGGLFAVLGDTLQVGVRWEVSLVAPQIMRLSLGTGIQQLFQKLRDSWLLYVKLILGMVVLTISLYNALFISTSTLLLFSMSWETQLKMGSNQVWTWLLALLSVAVLEYIWRRKKFYKELSMSPEELKRELKEEEGDPMIRSVRRSLHESIMYQDLVKRVRRSKVIIVRK